MKEKTYHHENLKKELIEAGIEMMNEEGEDALSLRKIAARCNVSNAAPYAHFAGKEELLEAMRQYVTDEFTKRMEQAIDECKHPDTDEVIRCMGREYVRFFIANPDYYKFLYFHDFIKVDLSPDSRDNFRPFDLLKENVIRINKIGHVKKTKKEQEIEIVKLWTAVQGLASIASLPNVKCDYPWDQMIDEVLFIREAQAW